MAFFSTVIGNIHNFLFPQDKVVTYEFPADGGKLTNEERVQEMIDDSGGGGGGYDYQQTRRDIIVSS